MCVGDAKSHGTCVEIGEQLRRLGSDSIMWAPGIKLRKSGLEASAVPPEPSCWSRNVYI